jgi:hypothetical protein
MQMSDMVVDFQSCLFVNMSNESVVPITIGCILKAEAVTQFRKRVGRVMIQSDNACSMNK